MYKKMFRADVCIMQSATSGDEWSVVSGCQKVESLIGSGASSVKSPTDVDIIAGILQKCSQFISTHNEVSIALMTSTACTPLC